MESGVGEREILEELSFFGSVSYFVNFVLSPGIFVFNLCVYVRVCVYACVIAKDFIGIMIFTYL